MIVPLMDTCLDEARREIQRRLPREGMLKRIEAKEMRRAAATGRMPPSESAVAGGPTVHDAADAIGEAEGRRRACQRGEHEGARELFRGANLLVERAGPDSLLRSTALEGWAAFEFRQGNLSLAASVVEAGEVELITRCKVDVLGETRCYSERKR
jgi:hypothetical protein